MLSLEIEYLTGVSFASLSRTRPAPDFPPQPERVFSALVASWGARGQKPDERAALEWLEAQPTPEIWHGDFWRRSGATVFVPPNDDRIRGDNPATIRRVLPAYRSRQAREFPAVRLDDGERRVAIVWTSSEPSDETLASLNNLATDTSYVGHSASLTRLAFRRDRALPKSTQSVPASRIVSHGRLDRLEAAFAHGEHVNERDTLNLARSPAQNDEPAHRSVFASDWLILELLDRKGNRRLDLRAAPIAARLLRDAIMSGYDRIGLGDAVPEGISGHKPDGSASDKPHLAIAPLAFFGPPYADGRLFGYALVPPRGSGLLYDEAFRSAIFAISEYDERDERRILTIHPKGGAWQTSLGIVDSAMTRHSLRPEPYCCAARRWASVTPIVLDRHLRTPRRARTRGDNAAIQAEIESVIEGSVERIGLPRPVSVRADKHATITGAPSAQPPRGAPAWMAWQVSRSLASRRIVHATLTFETPVEGPLLIGAGRYVGLGLCRGLPENGQEGGDD
jgi:CRISPR-associated protein Csb2